MVADKLENIYRGGSKIKDYAYDDNGNTIFLWESGVGAKAFTYDAENRISAISGAYTASYSYNGLDTRVSKTEASVSTNFRRDGAGVTSPVIEDSYARYTPGISESRGSTPSTSVTKYMHSGIKSADVQTNSSQTIDATRKYDAFGVVLSSTGTWSGPFGNAGKFGYQEDASGYQLLGHRYYDPSTGRFLSRDPIQDGRNWYAYCDNNPIESYDADGLKPVKVTSSSPYYQAILNAINQIILVDPVRGRYLLKLLKAGKIFVDDELSPSVHGEAQVGDTPGTSPITISAGVVNKPFDLISAIFHEGIHSGEQSTGSIPGAEEREIDATTKTIEFLRKWQKRKKAVGDTGGIRRIEEEIADERLYRDMNKTIIKRRKKIGGGGYSSGDLIN